MRNDFGHAERLKRERDAERERKARTSWGVFIWRGDGKYRAQDAVRVFKQRARAETMATQDDRYVVRSIEIGG